MTLDAGRRLGPYEIVSPIGAGGMGEVYRARDTRLDRTVAIKVLPSQLAADPQLRERFDREARAISSLSHPNICTLYDIGHEAGTDFLVLEYLEGQTLAERLAPGSAAQASVSESPKPEVRRSMGAGRLSVSEALSIAIQIADALDKAHRSGIVHRDLKPANVMLTKSGAKLLDFGLAKASAPVVAAQGLSMLPTTPPALTAQGAILGTFQYMAPEQIEGLDADARTDIFAFGALMFEMLTARRAFEGQTRAQLLGSILKDEPPRVSTFQPLASKALDRIVSTCLAKAPEDRWQTARDLVRELRWVAEAGSQGDAGSPTRVVSDDGPGASGDGSRPKRSLRAAWAVAGVLAAALIATTVVAIQHVREIPAPQEVVQFAIPLPDGTQFGGLPLGGTGTIPQVAISPDGRNVVFVARRQDAYALWVRPIGSAEARLLSGTDGGAFPFWSPDSRYVGFFADGKLKKVQLTGGPPIVLCDALRGFGGSWNRANVILFSPGAATGAVGGLQRVPAAGGTPVPASALDTEYGETSHRWPHFLPDGRHFLFTGVTGTCCPASTPARVKVGTLDGPEVVTLISGEVESSTAYASGHLLFDRVSNLDGSLMAQPFDPDARQLKGEAFPLVEHLASEGSRYASFSASDTGVLLFAHGVTTPMTRLTWFDREGKTLGTVGDPASYLEVSLSRDDAKIAVTLASGAPENRDIWVLDAARGTQKRLTFDPRADGSPVWSPDGGQIAFSGNRPQATLRLKVADPLANDEQLWGQNVAVSPTDWSADGKFLAYTLSGGVGGFTDIWVLPMFGDRKPFPFAQTADTEANASFSPDGRWIAYDSTEGGAAQVYVQPFPPNGGKRQISKDGGVAPTWIGKEVFFIGLDRSTIMAVDVDTTGKFESGTPRALFSPNATIRASGRRYAVTHDGKRFLLNLNQQQSTTTTPLTVIVNWPATIQK
jgi:eukaryotic-like serine/threonine-protein kinase